MSEQHSPGKEQTDIDAVSGVETTGHQWDGIKELNNPLPKWWLYTFYITVAWALIFTVFFPAWPMLTEATKGVLGYSTRAELVDLQKAAKAEQAVFTDRIAASPVAEIAADAELTRFARAGGAAAFRAHCIQCHGSGAAGGVGFPNLLDDEWIWGGALPDIELTIRRGIRQLDAEGYPVEPARFSQMPAYGRDELLNAEEIEQVAEYVLQIAKQDHDATAAAKGAEIYSSQCVSCHGEDGRGQREIGAPNLTDAIWLYGGDRDTIIRSIYRGPAGMMPAWGERLDDETIKMLTIYVHDLGGGE